MNYLQKMKAAVKAQKSLRWAGKAGKLNDRINAIGKKLEDLDKKEIGEVAKKKLAKPLQFAAAYLVAKQAKFEKLMSRHYVQPEEVKIENDDEEVKVENNDG